MASEQEIVELLLRLDVALLERIEDFQHKHRISNRTVAIRWLLDYALKTAQKHKVDPKLSRANREPAP